MAKGIKFYQKPLILSKKYKNNVVLTNFLQIWRRNLPEFRRNSRNLIFESCLASCTLWTGFWLKIVFSVKKSKWSWCNAAVISSKLRTIPFSNLIDFHQKSCFWKSICHWSWGLRVTWEFRKIPVPNVYTFGLNLVEIQIFGENPKTTNLVVGFLNENPDLRRQT